MAKQKPDKNNVKHRFEHDREKLTFSKMAYILAHNFNVVFFVEGILIIAFARQISSVLHWIVGPTLIFFGLCGIIYCLVKRRSRDMNKLAGVSIVLILLGIVVIIRLQGATEMIAFIFGLAGMALGCLRLIDFLSTVKIKFWSAIFDLAYASATLGLSLALLYNQFEGRYILLILLGCLHIVLSLRSMASRVLENEKVMKVAHKVADFGVQLNERIINTLHIKPAADEVAGIEADIGTDVIPASGLSDETAMEYETEQACDVQSAAALNETE